MNENEKYAWRELSQEWDNVRSDRLRGAAELLRSALHALRRFLEGVESPDYSEIEPLMNELANLRKDMAGFKNCVRFLNNENPDTLLNSVIQLEEYLDQSLVMIAQNAVQTFHKPVSVLTISRSSVVEQVITALHRSGILEQVIQLESRPAYEGRKNAERLLDSGIHVTVIPDAAMGYWIYNADTVIVGADAISTEGNFLGKIGCYPLALLAREAGCGYYVTAERLKFTHIIPDEYEANKHFSTDQLGWETASERLALSNIIFETTPGALVTGFITEFGFQKPPLTILETLSF